MQVYQRLDDDISLVNMQSIDNPDNTLFMNPLIDVQPNDNGNLVLMYVNWTNYCICCYG